MYVNIDNCFFINCKKPNKILLKSIAFVANQKKVKNSVIEKAYEKKDKVNIDLPENSLKNNVDIIIKRNFKSDFKLSILKNLKYFTKSTPGKFIL